MKKYLVFAAAALAALASCSKVEPETENGPEISFLAANYLSTTKAADDHNHLEFYSAGTFNVAGYFSPGDWSNLSGATNYMGNGADGTFVGISKIGDVWKNATPYYWPKAGSISFIGYYPSTVSATVTGTNALAINISSYTVDATLQAQAAKVTTSGGNITDDKNDLMIADAIYSQRSNEDGETHFTNGVAMLFHHKLAKVNFLAKQKTLEGIQSTLPLRVVINDLQIKAINNVGAFNGTAWTPTSATITSSGSFVTNAALTVDGTPAASSVLTTTATAQGSEYYVLPQSLDAEAKIVYVKYTVYTHDNQGKVIEKKEYETNVPLKSMKNSSGAITAWEINKIYNYTLTIDPFTTEIYFDPAVVDWSSPAVEADADID